MDIEKTLTETEDAGGGTYFSPQEGNNTIRILPPWKATGKWSGNPFFKVTLHYGFEVEGRNRTVYCLGEDDCPVCAFVTKLQAASTKGTRAVANKIRTQLRDFCNVLDRKRGHGRVQIYGLRPKQMRELRSFLRDPDFGDITHPKEGHDIVIERTGSGLSTRYSIRVRPKSSLLGLPDWKKKVHKLDQELIGDMEVKDIEEILEKNYGDLLYTTIPTKNKKKRKKVEEEEVEEEEEKEKKKGKKKRKKGK